LPTALTELPTGALDDQPALQALRAQITAEQAAVGEAKAAFEPALGVSVGYGIKAGGMSNTGSIGVSISLPLFAGNRQTPQLRAAQQRLGSAQFALDDEAAQLHAQQAALQASVQSLSARLVNYDEHILPDLSRIARLTQNQFGAGNGDFSAVIEAQESLISARLARLTLSLDRARQLIDLRYLLEKSS
jgi:outer membrane protein TolC